MGITCEMDINQICSERRCNTKSLYLLPLSATSRGPWSKLMNKCIRFLSKWEDFYLFHFTNLVWMEFTIHTVQSTIRAVHIVSTWWRNREQTSDKIDELFGHRSGCEILVWHHPDLHLLGALCANHSSSEHFLNTNSSLKLHLQTVHL